MAGMVLTESPEAAEGARQAGQRVAGCCESQQRICELTAPKPLWQRLDRITSNV